MEFQVTNSMLQLIKHLCFNHVEFEVKLFLIVFGGISIIFISYLHSTFANNNI